MTGGVSVGFLRCPGCHELLPGPLRQASFPARCFTCGATVEVEVFPALLRPPAPLPAGEAPLDSEAGCFYHPARKAVVPCAVCGCFLCTLCEVELAGEHLCPTCLEGGRRRGELPTLVTQRTLHDQIAFSLALLPMLFFFVTVITAPMAIYMVFRYWRAPSSLLPRTKVRFVAAFLLAGMQMAGWGFFLVSVL